MQQSQSPSQQPTGEWDQFTRQAAIVILLLGVLFLISILRPIINLLGVTAIFILILLYPVNKLRTKTHLRYPVVVILVFVPVAVLLFFILGNLTQWFINNAQSLANQLKQTTPLSEGFKALMVQNPGAMTVVSDLLRTAGAFLERQFSAAMTFIALACTSFFLAFLFILEMPANLAHSFQSLSTVSQREIGVLFVKLSNVWTGWLRSTVITSIIIGTTTAFELYLFGIPNAAVLGVISGLLNLIPTFGPLVSYLLIIVVTYTQGSTRLSLSPLTLTLLVWGVNLLINQVVRLVIFPRLAGKATHLPFFLVILGLVVAAVLWGVVGVILVIPLLGSAGEVLNYVIRKINRQDPYPGETLPQGFRSEQGYSE